MLHLSMSHSKKKNTAQKLSWHHSFTKYRLKIEPLFERGAMYFDLRNAVQTTERTGTNWKKDHGGFKNMVDSMHDNLNIKQHVNCGYDFPPGMFPGHIDMDTSHCTICRSFRDSSGATNFQQMFHGALDIWRNSTKHTAFLGRYMYSRQCSNVGMWQWTSWIFRNLRWFEFQSGARTLKFWGLQQVLWFAAVIWAFCFSNGRSLVSWMFRICSIDFYWQS